MTTARAFSVTFALAVVCEAIGFALDGKPSIGEVILFGLGYALLVALGFLVAQCGHGYATAFASTWPFVLLWFLVGVFNMAWDRSATPPGFAHDHPSPFWGYVVATVMFLPLAFGASALGVWLRRFVRRRRAPPSSALTATKLR